MKLYELLEELKKHEASRVILNYFDAKATDVEVLIEDGEMEESKRIADEIFKILNGRRYGNVVIGSYFFYTPEYVRVLENSPEKISKLLERQKTEDVDIIELEPTPYTEFEFQNFLYVSTFAYFIGEKPPVPTTQGTWDPELRRSIIEKYRKVEKYLKFVELKKDELYKVLGSRGLNRLVADLVYKLASYRLDATSTAIMKLPYREEPRAKDIRDIARLMLASKYGLDFDFERFERAATVLMGKGWKEKLKKYMEKYAGEYLAHLDYFQG